MWLRSTTRGGSGFNPSRVAASALFNGSSSQLNRTPSVEGNRQRYVISLWARRPGGSTDRIVSAGSNDVYRFWIGWVSTGAINMHDYHDGGIVVMETSNLIPDSEWRHIVYSYDGFQGALYVNGVAAPLSVNSNNFTTPKNSVWGSASNHRVGGWSYKSGDEFDGSIAQLVSLDGVSIQNGDVTIDDFGEWITAGTNGQIWAARSDAALVGLANVIGGQSFALTDQIGDGIDASANGNHFTPSNISQAANGSLDTPSRVLPRFNRLLPGYGTVTNSGKTFHSGNSAQSVQPLTMGMRSDHAGKYYLEFSIEGGGTSGSGYGVGLTPRTDHVGFNVSYSTSSFGTIHYDSTGRVMQNGLDVASGLTPFSVGARVAMEVDFQSDTIEWFLIGGGSIYRYENAGLGDYPKWWPFVSDRAFTVAIQYSIVDPDEWQGVPSPGFVALDSTSIPTPEFQGVDYFKAHTRVGTGADVSITGVGFSPDLIWNKCRSSVFNNALTDRLRGVGETIFSDQIFAESFYAEKVKSFDVDGFTHGSDAGGNNSGDTFVDWLWKASGDPVLNNGGSTPSMVSAADAGHFSIVSWTETALANQTVGHGLADPDLIFLKSRSNPYNWYSWTRDIGMTLSSGHYLLLNERNARHSDGISAWIHQGAGSLDGTTFKTGGSSLWTGDNIAYLFKSIPGLCKVGSYLGNGSVDGPFVDCGFRPAYVLLKSATSYHPWTVFDNARNETNPRYGEIYPTATNVESTTTSNSFGFYGSGFKVQGSAYHLNTSGATFIYLAIADVAGGGNLPPVPGG